MTSQSHYPLNYSNCSFSQLCLPFNLNSLEMDKKDDIIQRKSPLQKGERLFETGDKLSSLYAVRSGSFKSYSISENGDEQITTFHLPGEVIGFDSMSDDMHQTVSQALETAMVCELPFDVRFSGYRGSSSKTPIDAFNESGNQTRSANVYVAQPTYCRRAPGLFPAFIVSPI